MRRRRPRRDQAKGAFGTAAVQWAKCREKAHAPPMGWIPTICRRRPRYHLRLYRRGYDDELPPANRSSMTAANARALALACHPVGNTAHNRAVHRYFLAEATALFQRD